MNVNAGLKPSQVRSKGQTFDYNTNQAHVYSFVNSQGRTEHYGLRKSTSKANRGLLTIDRHPTIVSSPRPTSTSTQQIDGYKVSKSGKAKRSKKRTHKPY